MIIFYSSSKAEILINDSDIDDVLKLIENTIITSIPKLLEKCSGFKWCLLRYLNHVDHHPARII